MTYAARITALPPGILKLAKFGVAMLHAHRGNDASEIGDIDGFTAQEKAEACGVIVARTVTEPCCEACVCGEITDFPVECYFVPDDVKQAREELKDATAADTELSALRARVAELEPQAADAERWANECNRLDDYICAFTAACDFIDAHVGDPDMTAEMVRTYAEFQKWRAAINKGKL